MLSLNKNGSRETLSFNVHGLLLIMKMANTSDKLVWALYLAVIVNFKKSGHISQECIPFNTVEGRFVIWLMAV